MPWTCNDYTQKHVPMSRTVQTAGSEPTEYSGSGSSWPKTGPLAIPNTGRSRSLVAHSGVRGGRERAARGGGALRSGQGLHRTAVHRGIAGRLDDRAAARSLRPAPAVRAGGAATPGGRCAADSCRVQQRARVSALLPAHLLSGSDQDRNRLLPHPAVRDHLGSRGAPRARRVGNARRHARRLVWSPARDGNATLVSRSPAGDVATC
jgi:hypothetical protein